MRIISPIDLPYPLLSFSRWEPEQCRAPPSADWGGHSPLVDWEFHSRSGECKLLRERNISPSHRYKQMGRTQRREMPACPRSLWESQCLGGELGGQWGGGGDSTRTHLLLLSGSRLKVIMSGSWFFRSFRLALRRAIAMNKKKWDSSPDLSAPLSSRHAHSP